MECQASDSKKLFKVFDASKRKRSKKKREGFDDTNSVITDESNSACQTNVGRISGKTSLQDLPPAQTVDGHHNGDSVTRERTSSHTRSRDGQRSPRRLRRPTRERISLALKSGMISTPRSISPPQDGEAGAEPPTNDQDSLIYTFLEEAIKRDKNKHRHSRRHDRRGSHERDASREQRHRHRRRRDVPSRDRDKHHKEESPTPAIDQSVLLETFAKLCAQMNEKTSHNNPERTHSHKSLQCEVTSRHNLHDVDRRPERLRSREKLHEHDRSRRHSQENCQHRHSREKVDPRQDKSFFYEKDPKYASKIDVNCSRTHQDDRYRIYPPEPVATRTCIDQYRDRPERDYDRRRYDDDRRRYFEQKTSRSFDVHRECYEDEKYRRTSRSDAKDKRYDDKYYEKPIIDARERHFPSKERRVRRPSERNSITSFRERDRYSERERDSGLSVADGETSTMSGRSNYLRAVKQEISEQREAMDKMMKLWKELMRCFKGISQTQVKDKTLNETACENVRESAAAQLRLWRECMRRYETVARDVGDTDARLMDEISKQRSEMSEMANMWQECLQRYRDMSNDFKTLKQQLATSESPTRLPAAPPLVCAEGEGLATAPAYRLPANYPQIPPPPVAYPCTVGTPLRGRASAPPAWWYGGGARSPRRRSSPDSRDARDSDSRRRHKDSPREESRYKEKSSKPSAARSNTEHRRRKR